MTAEGTLINGVVVFDSPPTAPEGTRVRVNFELSEESFEYPHPLAPYDRKKEIVLLRERLASNEPGVPLKEAMAKIRAELNLPEVDRA